MGFCKKPVWVEEIAVNGLLGIGGAEKEGTVPVRGEIGGRKVAVQVPKEDERALLWSVMDNLDRKRGAGELHPGLKHLAKGASLLHIVHIHHELHGNRPFYKNLPCICTPAAQLERDGTPSARKRFLFILTNKSRVVNTTKVLYRIFFIRKSGKNRKNYGLKNFLKGFLLGGSGGLLRLRV